jgi:hypothetical protein
VRFCHLSRSVGRARGCWRRIAEPDALCRSFDRSHAGPIVSNPPVAPAQQLAGPDPKRICAAVAAFYNPDNIYLSKHLDPRLARAIAARLCCRHTEASLRELAQWLGLSRADSVPNLTRRLEARLKASPELSKDLAEIMRQAANAPTDGAQPADVTRTPISRRSGRAKTKAE